MSNKSEQLKEAIEVLKKHRYEHLFSTGTLAKAIDTVVKELEKPLPGDIPNIMTSHVFLHTHGDGSDGNEWGVLGIYWKQEDALIAANNYEYDSNVETWDVY